VLWPNLTVVIRHHRYRRCSLGFNAPRALGQVAVLPPCGHASPWLVKPIHVDQHRGSARSRTCAVIQRFDLQQPRRPVSHSTPMDTSPGALTPKDATFVSPGRLRRLEVPAAGDAVVTLKPSARTERRIGLSTRQSVRSGAQPTLTDVPGTSRRRRCFSRRRTL